MAIAFPESTLFDSLDIEEAVQSSEIGPPVATGKYRPLGEDEVKSIVSNEIIDAHGAIMAGSEISEERRRALKYFFGKPLGNEIAGRSQVVLTEVADTIHWIMPSLMRMFASGEDIFEFEPTHEGERDMAEQATAYINKVFWDEMEGFDILYDWFFTALLEKNGFVTVFWEELVEPKIEQYEGLTDVQLELLQMDGRGLEIIELGERSAQMPDGSEMPLYDVTVKQTKRVGRMKVRGIPPEEFLIARRVTRLDDDVPFVGERIKMTASELIAMGFDPEEVASWPSDQSPEFHQGRTERLAEEETFPLTTAERSDAASREMWVNNVYIRIDEDGDGYSELRRIMTIGDTSMELLLDEYANFPPYASLTASPIPHKFFGQSIVDLIGDLQVIRTTLMRQLLDNLYLQNNVQLKVVPGQVEISDLLTNRPGNLIRMDSLDSVEPLVTPPLPPIAMEMMNYLDQIREIRVGVSRWTQGLDGSSLNGTATGVNAMMGASQARVELIGRVFASTGLKRLGKLLLRTFKQKDNKSRSVRLHGNWVDVDPSMWNDDMDVKIKTGLGVGAAAEQIQFLMATIQLQKEALMSGASFMVQPKDLYRAVTELNKAMGFRGDEVFFTDPGDEPWPEPEPDTKLLENQRRVEDDRKKAALEGLRIDNERAESERLAEFRDRELEENSKLKREEMETRKAIAELQAKAARERSTDAGSSDSAE